MMIVTSMLAVFDVVDKEEDDVYLKIERFQQAPF